MTSCFTKALIFSSPEQTGDFASAIAPILEQGDTLLLEGSIGTGKTHFARSLIQTRLSSVGIGEDVPSPTFTLVQTYDDTISEIWHADLYRLSDPQEITELGLEEAFSQAICLVEWPENMGDVRPQNALTIRFEAGVAEETRILTFSGNADRWSSVVEMIDRTTAPNK